MVLVARRLEPCGGSRGRSSSRPSGSAIVAVSNALFGLPDGVSPLLWWVFAALSTAFTVGLLAGLAKTGTERPPL
jgi:hypothetical protein